MRTKYALCALAPIALALQLAAAGAAPNEGLKLRWEGWSSRRRPGSSSAT
jgi:hypothetical protein